MTGTELLVGYYGDDFTGSTDVLESLSRNGVDTLLFLETPEPDDLADRDVQAIGIAGTSRSMAPAEMEEELPPRFEALADLDPEILVYKVCSTFDSSPEVGSIGRAIDIGQGVVESPFVPVVVAAPSLEPRGRYLVFGNLFATVEGETHRLDRHPTMKNHPVTPMAEADLRRHLGEQTDKQIGLVDITDIEEGSGSHLSDALDEVRREGSEVVFFDGLNHQHQENVGSHLWEVARSLEGPLFSAASSGLTYGVTAHLQNADVIERPPEATTLDAVDRLMVMSGSASPATAEQIEWALEHGFVGIRLDTAGLVDPDEVEDARRDAVEDAVGAIEDGNSVVLYSALGPDDPVIDETERRYRGEGSRSIAGRLGVEQGRITRRILSETGLSRLCVAGGDTSGFVAPELEIYALEFLAPVAPGSPLCRGHARTARFDGLEVALKGGQVETVEEEANYFEAVRRGGTV